jgi:CRP/FNR family transcriptional regulator, cyclic AMP receptor protein
MTPSSMIGQHVFDFRTRNAALPTGGVVKLTRSFDVEALLRSPDVRATIATYRPTEIIVSQGDACGSVMYIQEGAVKLSVLSHSGKEGVVGIFDPGDFFGESAVAGRPVRSELATAMMATTVLIIPKEQMIRLLHDVPGLSDRFIEHLLGRNIRIEGDLVDQLLNSSEKRLARTLLLVGHRGKSGKIHRTRPRISQTTLAEMIGATRTRVNFFMRKFKRLGFIEYNGHLKVNDSLLKVILQDDTAKAPQRRAG